jgi:hypothetical protein
MLIYGQLATSITTSVFASHRKRSRSIWLPCLGYHCFLLLGMPPVDALGRSYCPVQQQHCKALGDRAPVLHFRYVRLDCFFSVPSTSKTGGSMLLM